MHYSKSATPDYYDPIQTPIILEQAVQPLLILSLLREHPYSIQQLLYTCRHRSDHTIRIQRSSKILSLLQKQGLIQNYSTDAPADSVISITDSGIAELHILRDLYYDCLEGVNACLNNIPYSPRTPLPQENIPPAQFQFLFGHQDAVFALILLTIHMRTPMPHKAAKHLCRMNSWTIIPKKEYIYRVFLSEKLMKIEGKTEDGKSIYCVTPMGAERRDELIRSYTNTMQNIQKILQLDSLHT